MPEPDVTLLQRRIAELEAQATPRPARMAGGGGPQDPGMEKRMSAVEAGLARLEIATTRIEALLTHTATRADVAEVKGAVTTVDAKLSALDGRVGRVETTVGTALTTAIGKAIGPWQFLGLLASAAAIIAGLAAAYAWASHQPWFPH